MIIAGARQSRGSSDSKQKITVDSGQRDDGSGSSDGSGRQSIISGRRYGSEGRHGGRNGVGRSALPIPCRNTSELRSTPDPGTDLVSQFGDPSQLTL